MLFTPERNPNPDTFYERDFSDACDCQICGDTILESEAIEYKNFTALCEPCADSLMKENN